MMKKINNKGFTLIELLAVIVILGILMIIAVPQVTKYIEQSKKDTYIDTAKAYINSARYMLLNDEFSDTTLPSDGQYLYIKLSAIKLEKGGTKSPYNKNITKGFVKVSNDSNNYNYYIMMLDDAGNGIDSFTSETSLSRNSIIKQSKTDIYQTKTVECLSPATLEDFFESAGSSKMCSKD